MMLAVPNIGEKRCKTCKHFSPWTCYTHFYLFKHFSELLQNPRL